MLPIILVCFALSVCAAINPAPFPTKNQALDRANLLNGRPQTITVRKGTESAIVSYDAETLTEYKALGFAAISVTEQTAIDTAAARAVSRKPVLDAAAKAQADQDAADTKLMNADLLAAWRADKAKKAKAAAAPVPPAA